MKKYHSPGRWAAGAYGLSLIAGAGIGALVGSDANSGQTDKILRAESDLTIQNGRVEEAHRNLIRVELDIGETCLTAVKIYLPGGELEPTPEDAVVSDLIGSPDRPCGDTPTEARASFRKIATANNLKFQADSARATEEKDLETAKDTTNESEIPGNIGIGLVFGGIIGIGVGAITAMVTEEVNINRGL